MVLVWFGIDFFGRVVLLIDYVVLLNLVSVILWKGLGGYSLVIIWLIIL